MAGEKFQAADLSKLFRGPKFASGGDSKIYRGTYDGEQVAVKIIQVPDLLPLDDHFQDEVVEKMKQAKRLKNMFKNEAAFLSRLNHYNIVKFVAAYENYPVYGILTEYLPGGCLRSYLNNLAREPLPLAKKIQMALDIAQGMAYLHSQGIVHRDLKPENVLIDQHFRLKIADFGVSCEEAKCEAAKDGMGTYRWMAPEVFRRKSYNRKADVYAFGLMLWELVFGQTPFQNMAPIQAAVAAANNNLRPHIPDDFPPAIGDLIRQCWSAQPKKRPDFWQIVVALEQLQDRLLYGVTLNKAIQIMEDHKHKHSGLHWLKLHKPKLGLIFG